MRAAADLYSAWDAAQPGKHYDQKAQQLKNRIEELQNSRKGK
jgi:hypothetical protein